MTGASSDYLFSSPQ